jgi:hypothetical protein
MVRAERSYVHRLRPTPVRAHRCAWLPTMEMCLRRSYDLLDPVLPIKLSTKLLQVHFPKSLRPHGVARSVTEPDTISSSTLAQRRCLLPWLCRMAMMPGAAIIQAMVICARPTRPNSTHSVPRATIPDETTLHTLNQCGNQRVCNVRHDRLRARAKDMHVWRLQPRVHAWASASHA